MERLFQLLEKVKNRLEIEGSVGSPDNKGDIFVEGENVNVLRSGKQRKGLHPKFLEKIQGRKSTRNIPIGDGVMEEDYEKI